MMVGVVTFALGVGVVALRYYLGEKKRIGAKHEPPKPAVLSTWSDKEEGSEDDLNSRSDGDSPRAPAVTAIWSGPKEEPHSEKETPPDK